MPGCGCGGSTQNQAALEAQQAAARRPGVDPRQALRTTQGVDVGATWDGYPPWNGPPVRTQQTA